MNPSARCDNVLSAEFCVIWQCALQGNANQTAQALRNSGLQPTIYDQTSNGRRFLADGGRPCLDKCGAGQ
jgi:hypothetical protein